MPSITTWTRLESQVRDPSMAFGLQARVHDPLWLLTRQWQLAEFKADNGGSPVRVQLDAEITRISRYIAGRSEPGRLESDVRPYDSRTPLEAIVEREGVVREGTATSEVVAYRQAAESGLQFLRLLGPLASKYKAEYLRRYKVPSLPDERRGGLDTVTRLFVELISERVPDGTALYRDVKEAGPGSLPAEPVIEAADRDAVLLALTAWRAWYDALFPEPATGNAWVPERMEHEFAVAAPLSLSASPTGEVVFTASEYWGGHLDWPSFDVDLDPQRRLGAPPQQFERLSSVLPAPVRFRGMPAPRFWQFENAQVNFGAIQAGPEDLAQLLLIEFALVYGNDFFVIPIDLNVGAVCRTSRLLVTDTFGDPTTILPSGESDGPNGSWRMYGLSRDRRSSVDAKPPELLFLPPVLGTSLHGATLEDVLFLRDEMANIAWAVERAVEGPGGRSLNRFEVYQSSRPERAAPSVSAAPRYRLATHVPDYWFPLLPVHSPSTDREIVFERRIYGQVKPWGRILEPDRTTPLQIYEEEVPRAGARVTRRYQYARWSDGSTHLWVGRRKQFGRGEGSSGLRFDILESP